MSYTPEDQDIQTPAHKILEGIREFTDAARKRMRDRGEWKAEHLAELHDMRSRLQDLELDLGKLAGL